MDQAHAEKDTALADLATKEKELVEMAAKAGTDRWTEGPSSGGYRPRARRLSIVTPPLTRIAGGGPLEGMRAVRPLLRKHPSHKIKNVRAGIRQ